MGKCYVATILVIAGWASVSFGEEKGGSQCGLHPCNSYHGISCYHPPPPEPCTCGDCKHPHVSLPGQAARAAKLVDQLDDCHYRCRASAACKLGCRLCVDHCKHPEIIAPLIHALQCDACYVVRRKAAKALGYQVAANQCVWTALFLASRLDPHYLVREQAADSMNILRTQVSPECIKEWRADAEEFEKAIKKDYQPGKENCYLAFPPCCGGHGESVAAEPLPAPKEDK